MATNLFKQLNKHNNIFDRLSYHFLGVESILKLDINMNFLLQKPDGISRPVFWIFN